MVVDMRQGRTSGRAQRSALLLVALLLTLLLLAGLGWLLASQTQAPAGAAQPAVATGLQPRRAIGTELEASSTASTNLQNAERFRLPIIQRVAAR